MKNKTLYRRIDIAASGLVQTVLRKSQKRFKEVKASRLWSKASGRQRATVEGGNNRTDRDVPRFEMSRPRSLNKLVATSWQFLPQNNTTISSLE